MRSFGPWSPEQDNNNEPFLPAGNGYEEEDDGEEEAELIRALAAQGLSRHEIAALVSQLASRPSDEEDDEDGDDDDKKKKRKRSLEWRKWPRGGSLRWRRYLQDWPDADEEDGKFAGRGFHRTGPAGVQDDISRSVSQANRIQRPLKTKNAVSVINKRSAPADTADAAAGKAEEEPELPKAVSRKRRSIMSPPPEEVSKQSTENLTAASSPLSKDNDDEKMAHKDDHDDVKSVAEDHSGVIRKKSVDWDDYFGFDKRSNKKRSSGPRDDSDEALKEYLESEYYKSIAGSLAYRRKRSNNRTAHHYPQSHHHPHGGMEDAEEAMEAAFRAATESRQEEEMNELERIREGLLAELVENLSPEDLDAMTNQLAEELIETIEEDDEDEDDEDDDRNGLVMKRSIKKKKKRSSRKRGGIKKKRSFDDDDRRKRNPAAKHHPNQGTALLL